MFFSAFRYTVYKIVNRAEETGSHLDRHGSGRPKVSTTRDDRLIVRQSLQERRLTVPDLRKSLAVSGVNVSNSTVRRRLHEVGLQGRRATKKPLLTPKHREKRLAFAKAHSDWTWVDWSTVLFTDESKYSMFQTDGPLFVRRRPGEELLDSCVQSTVKFQGGGIMVWGAMSYRGTGLLYHVKGNLNGAGYIKILQECAIPTAHLLGYGDDYWYQDDGAPCHRARIVKDWQLENDFRC